MNARKGRSRRRRLKIIIVLAVVLAGLPVVARLWIHGSARGRIYTTADSVPECRVALVLGAGVHPDGSLSSFLTDRVQKSVELYKSGRVEKLLMSGDNRFSHYNEPEKMKDYAVKLGVPEEDIAMDFAGRRTYDSIYRAKHIFGQDRLIVVSQGFHLDRALFLSRALGVKAYGFAGRWPARPKDQIREIPACVSAILDVYILHPTPITGKQEEI